jgi:hypothetical protein
VGSSLKRASFLHTNFFLTVTEQLLTGESLYYIFLNCNLQRVPFRSNAREYWDSLLPKFLTGSNMGKPKNIGKQLVPECLPKRREAQYV